MDQAASGLTEVSDNLGVKKLLMHLPWKHVGNIDELLKDADMSTPLKQQGKSKRNFPLRRSR